MKSDFKTAYRLLVTAMAKFALRDKNEFKLMYWSPVVLIKFASIMHQGTCSSTL